MDFLAIAPAEIPDLVKRDMNRVLQAALDAADPQAAVQRALHCESSFVNVGVGQFPILESSHIRVLAIGKAAQRMALGVVQQLEPGHQIAGGLIITKRIDPNIIFSEQFEVLTAGHPIPDMASVQAGERIATFLRESAAGDGLICLISGGGSALACLPVDGVNLQDMQDLTVQLLACGAEIGEINAIRKHLDRIKGGGLVRLAHPAWVISLVLSDVIGSPLDVIASGPTVPDTTTFSTCWQIFEKYGLLPTLSASIRRHFERGLEGSVPENLGFDENDFGRVITQVVGSNYESAQAAVKKARECGFNAMLLSAYLKGEAASVGQILGSVLRHMALHGEPLARPACLVAGGETTVTLGKSNGLGGRNLETALGAVEEIQGLQAAALITLATDGEDGTTGAAGAIASGLTMRFGLLHAGYPEEYLTHHDSYTYFSKTGGLIQIGSTGTNVNDLMFLFTWKNQADPK